MFFALIFDCRKRKFTMRRYTGMFLLAALLMLPGIGYAAEMQHKAEQAGLQGAAMEAPQSEATKAYVKVMDAMHGPMMQGVMDPDPDVAFAKGMLPHHAGAVEMAKIELKYGKDPEMRKLAEEVIKAQEKEMTFMTEWLKKRGHPAK